MNMSPTIANLAAAMAKAQASMGGAHKDSNNPAFNSKYADLSSVVDAIKPHLSANGLAYFQFVQTSPEGVGVETLLTHSSGEYVAGEPFYVPVAKANAHGFGSALTYARRYSLAAACGLKADDDDGNAAAENPPKRDVAAAVAASGSGADVNKDAFEALDPETKKFVQEKAMEVMGVYEDKGNLAAWVERNHLDDEEKMALWYCLPSHVRRAIKDSQRAAAAAVAAAKAQVVAASKANQQGKAN